MILLGSYVFYTQQICWVHFEAFIAETYVQLVATKLCATLLADPLLLEPVGQDMLTAAELLNECALYCTVRWLK